MPLITKNERIHLAATASQLAAWRLTADSEGVTLSEFLRRAAERRVAEAIMPSAGASRDRRRSHAT